MKKLIVFDSRKATAGTVFVAIRGEKADGHNFITQAIKQGCTDIVCEEKPKEVIDGVNYTVVADTHKVLGELASEYYGHPSRELKLVGVTGTNGKTTIATLLYRFCMARGVKAGLFSTVKNYVGEEAIDATQTTPDPLTLNKLMREMVDAGCQYCFMEVSSHSIVQKRIAGLHFAGGIFTNITHDHLDYHKTMENYINAKKLFFDELPSTAFALTNLDDRNGEKMLQNTKAKKYSYSLRTLCDYKGEIVEESFEGMLLRINGREAFMQFVGRFNASNLLAVYGATQLLGFDSEESLVMMSGLVPVDGRFEAIHSNNGVTAIVDYAHTPDALENVIKTINAIRRDEQKWNQNAHVASELIVVVGCGGDRDKTKRPEMAKIAVAGSNKLILTSDNPRTEKASDIINDMLSGLSTEEKIQTIVIEDRREAIKAAVSIAQKGDIILVAGKGHETYQEVNGVRSHFDDREEISKCFNS